MLGRTLASRSLLLAGFSATLTLGAALASGQDRGGAPRRDAPRDERRDAPREESSARREHSTPESEPDAPVTDDGANAESVVVERGGEKVKAIRFSGLDVSGRLKSPQLLYFLNRMRAEFDRPRLPHRSFIPELERSSHGKSF